MTHVHRRFFHYKEFPLSVRVLYTATLLTLGLGYMFALLHVYNSHSGRDGAEGLSTTDIAIAYSGSQEQTKIEAALLGPMSVMLPSDEKGEIFAWVRNGVDEQRYEQIVAPIIESRCLSCHDGSNPHIYSFNDYESVRGMAEMDTGMDIFTLVRVSHIHLFSLTFIFFITGIIYSHAFVRPVWFKAVVIGAPFVAIVLDIMSWYLTKIHPGFAWVVIAAGALMGISFTIQWFVSIYQIWFSKYKPDENIRDVT